MRISRYLYALVAGARAGAPGGIAGQPGKPLILRQLKGLLVNDLRNITRDPMLLYIPLLPLITALVFHFAVPLLAHLLSERLGFDLRPYYPLVASLFLYLVPGLVGVMVGFLLLDEKDENTVLALLVSPLPLSVFLLYRAALPTLLGTLVTLLTFPLTNLVPIGLVPLLLVSFLASLTGPVVALFLSALVRGKVAGLNMMKFSNSLLILPIAAFFLPMPLQLWAGIIPHYWGMKVFMQAIEGQPYGLYALAALVYSLGLIGFLLRVYRRSVAA